MTSFIDYHWKVDDARGQRDGPDYNAERSAARARINVVMAAAKQRKAAQRHQAQATRPDVDKSLPATPHTPTHPPGAALPAPIEEKSVFVRVGWRLKLKELFRPEVRDKRLAEELTIADYILEKPEQRVEPYVESPSLPGAGLQKLKEQDEKPLPPSPVNETDPNLTRAGDDDEIQALPPLPGHHHEAPAAPSMPAPLPTQDEHENVDGPFLESLADPAMDEALAEADAPGNRSSTRPALPVEWRAEAFSQTMGSSGMMQPTSTSHTGFLPLPSAVMSPGIGSLPNLSVSTSRLGRTRAGMDEDGDGAQETPASGKWFGGGNGD